MRHIILFSIAAVVLAGVAARVVTSIQSPKPFGAPLDVFMLAHADPRYLRAGAGAEMGKSVVPSSPEGDLAGNFLL